MAIHGEKISIFGDGQQLRDFNFVDDVVDSILLATDNEVLYGTAYNLGSDDRYSLIEFVELLARYCDFEYGIIPFPPDHEAIDIGDYYADSSLFRGVTGWAPQVSLEEGLRRTVEYFKPRIASYV